jgi:hypothetical protein
MSFEISELMVQLAEASGKAPQQPICTPPSSTKAPQQPICIPPSSTKAPTICEPGSSTKEPKPLICETGSSTKAEQTSTVVGLDDFEAVRAQLRERLVNV